MVFFRSFVLLLLYFILSLPVASKAEANSTPSTCNGFAELCSLKYSEATFATTHNASVSQAYQLTFLNQTKSLTEQLDDGIRGLMLDVDYNLFKTPTLCHGNNACSAGWLSTESGFGEIETWLSENRNHVVTLIFESYVEAEDLLTALDDAGLMDYAYVPASQDSPKWDQTLGEMISSGKRLVIFTVQGKDYRDGYTENSTKYMNAGLLYGNFFIRQSAYSGALEGKWSCDCVDGRTCNNPVTQLYVVNHFVPSIVGTGDIGNAGFVNRTPSVLRHAEKCKKEIGRANFIAVDFYEAGAGPIVAARALNGVINSSYKHKDQRNCRNDNQCWEGCDTFCVKPAVKKGKSGCGKNPRAFFDPIHGGTCWTCPIGYKRTWDPVTTETACATSWFGKKSPATKVFDSACSKQYTSTSFADPNGYCWDCEGYSRTAHAVTRTNACVERSSGNPHENQDIRDEL